MAVSLYSEEAVRPPGVTVSVIWGQVEQKLSRQMIWRVRRGQSSSPGPPDPEGWAVLSALQCPLVLGTWASSHKSTSGTNGCPYPEPQMWDLPHVSSLPVFRTLSPQIIACFHRPHTSDQVTCMPPHSLPDIQALLTLLLMASLLVETTPSPMAHPTEHCLTNNSGLF